MGLGRSVPIGQAAGMGTWHDVDPELIGYRLDMSREELRPIMARYLTRGAEREEVGFELGWTDTPSRSSEDLRAVSLRQLQRA